MWALAATVLGASLAGSAHCAGMCGPFAAVVGGAGRSVSASAAYHAGRLSAYATLGALAGAVGGAVELAGDAAGVRDAAAIAASALVVLWGIAMLLGALGVRALPGHSDGASRLLARLLARFRERPPLARAGALGVATALLPCGWLWGFVLTAAGTSSPALGAAVMALFWTGTLPALVAVGALARSVMPGPGARRGLAVAAAVAVIAVGLAGVARRASAFAPGGAEGGGCAHCHAGEAR